MLIGLDLDNTIACYDSAIAEIVGTKLALPLAVPRSKLAIREYLRRLDREDLWTEFQGELYGPGMKFAKPYPGCLQAISDLCDAGNEVVVISHRTRFPYAGEQYDLHYFAREWIEKNINSWLSVRNKLRQVTFHEKRTGKLTAIRRAGCRFFLDDLPEVLSDPEFPEETVGILFSPGGDSGGWSGISVSTWAELRGALRHHGQY
jgi:hypothetical protein